MINEHASLFLVTVFFFCNVRDMYTNLTDLFMFGFKRLLVIWVQHTYFLVTSLKYLWPWILRVHWFVKIPTTLSSFPLYCGRATLPYAWAGSTGAIPRPHGACTVFHRVRVDTGGLYPDSSHPIAKAGKAVAKRLLVCLVFIKKSLYTKVHYYIYFKITFNSNRTSNVLAAI